MIAILRDEMGKGAFPAILHCFSSGADLAKVRPRTRSLRLLLRHPDLQERAGDPRRSPASCRRDRLLVETDAPYLAPVPHRGQRNEPSYVRDTAAVLAEVKGVTVDAIAKATTENFMRLFTKVPRDALADRTASHHG
ncbi:MAG: TatD family hydrolase [Candidatus Kaistia colombiensis]|nr:MAG: TatD family hydrolase [Kaistia sp.]